MTAVSEFNRYAEELEARLLLKTSPIAIKMLRTEADIPKGAMRPRKDTGSHLDLCQGFAMSRRERAVVAMLKEDHWCYVPVIAHGLAEPPDYFLEGNMDFPARVADQQAAKNLAKNSPAWNMENTLALCRPRSEKPIFSPIWWRSTATPLN
jgi:uncharacterized protein (DUF169 family)